MSSHRTISNDENVKLSLLTFESWSKGAQLGWPSGDLRNFRPIHFVSWSAMVDKPYTGTNTNTNETGL